MKSSKPNQEQKSSNNNQYNTKRTALKSNQPTEQQNQTETKNQQHDEIINNHNQHARNTSYTRSNINTINRREEQPKNLKHASIQQNGGGNSDQILAELIHEMQQVTMDTENLKKRFNQTFGNVVNLSDNLFPKSEFSLLNKNLNFCPRPNKYNKQNLSKDLLKFYRNIKLRRHFQSTENNSNEPIFKSNSNWLPDKLPSCVETFITAINHDIKSSKTKKLPRDNLTKSERKALINLQKRNDIIITKADKGGAVVILDIKDYIDEANRQLNDTNNYEQLDFDPTELHTEKIKSEINNLKNENLLTLRTANSLLEEKIKTPEFHLLLKIHKANNPGRPVISSVNCHTSRISEFVDDYLQPEVKKLKSYVKDTTDFIKKIEAIDHVSDDSYLVSLDVRSLYTNIPHKEGIEAVKQKFKKSKPSISIKVILTFLNLF